MIKLGGLVNLKPITEAPEDRYVSIGFGKFKEKGKEDDENAPTFEKDGNKFVPISTHKAASKDEPKKDKPKVNIFNKDKEEPKSQSKDSTDYTKLTTTPLVKKTKDDITKVNAVVSQFLDKADDVVKNGAADGGKSPRKIFKQLKDYIQGLRDTNQFDDDALNKAYYYANDVGNSYEFGGDENPKDSDEDSIKNSVEKIQNLIKSKNESSTKLGRLLPEGLINEGTRSQVGIIDRSGKIASAYVHYDGYPSNMKPGLKKHMKNEKDVLNLIKRGGASGIYNNKDIKYYDEKPSPIKGDLKTLSRYFKSASSSGGAEYVYLYNMKDKKWYYADTYEDNELKKLF